MTIGDYLIDHLPKKEKCGCEMPFWTVDNLFVCAKCKKLLPDTTNKEINIYNQAIDNCIEAIKGLDIAKVELKGEQ